MEPLERNTINSQPPNWWTCLHLPFPSYHEINITSWHNVDPSTHDLYIITLRCLRPMAWPFIASLSSRVNFFPSTVSLLSVSQHARPFPILKKSFPIPPPSYLQVLPCLFPLSSVGGFLALISYDLTAEVVTNGYFHYLEIFSFLLLLGHHSL